jgi:hypothetical protein
MARKKPDLISDRARSLSEQIAALEAEIKKLDGQLQQPVNKPKWRSTTLPPGATPKPDPAGATSAPVFEEVPKQSLKSGPSAEAPELFNELGVRKYDLPGLVDRIRTHLRGPTTNNPRLVNYLAAGGVHGLRPLRYEKRVARNRFILFTAAVLLVLLGLILVLGRNH